MTRESRAAWLFSSPVLLASLVVLALPTLGAFLLSLTDFDIYALADLRFLRFVGLANYADLFRDPQFGRATANTLLFTLLGVPAAIGTSLAAALLISSAVVRLKPAWRVLLFAPYITTLVSSALVFRYVLDADTGLLNRLLAAVGVAPRNWLGDPELSIPAVVLFVVWKVFGYNMLVFIAALSAVPPEFGEAARLDGAGIWTRFRHVALPALGPALLLATVLSVAGFLQMFTEPYVMTHGGPAGRTTTLLFIMYEQGFGWWNLGRASAIAVLLFLAVLAATAVQTRLAARREWL